MTGIQRDKRVSSATAITVLAFLASFGPARAEVSQETLDSLSAPDTLETSIGTLEFKDGAPTLETARKVYDTLDFTRALNVYNNSFRGASALAIVKGFESIGAKPGDVVIFSELMDSNSLFLTPNADTVYYLAGLDLRNGPLVIEQPSHAVGTINDMWFSWIIDIGGPGPDRGRGGKYLIVGPAMTARCLRVATLSRTRRPTSPSMPRVPILSTTTPSRPSRTSSRTSRSIPTGRALSGRAWRRRLRGQCASKANRRSPK
ncbi:MAG TPA: DUF1254 domain-containing protein [Methyloceanibacter sp.]|nr:DUF1254 domain-containing protein [Methyloceanibacter sp.]